MIYTKEFSEYLELLNDIAFFKDNNGKYISCNIAFLRFLKKDRVDVIGKDDFEVFAHKKSALDIDELEQVFELSDGSFKYFELNKKSVFDKDLNEQGLFCIFKDVTKTKEYEFIYEDTNQILEYISIHDDLEKILEKIALLAETRSKNSKCSILILDENKTKFVDGSAPSLPSFYNEAIDGLEIGDMVGSCGSAAYNQDRVIVENIDTHENWKNFLPLTTKANLHACWSEPIFSSKNEILGTFAIYNSKAKKPTNFELKLISSYAHLVSVAIEKDRHDKMVIEKDIQLVQQAKLAQMGELLSMVAHQWRQPLATISAISTGFRVKLELETDDFTTKDGLNKHKDGLNEGSKDIDKCIQTLTNTLDDFRNFYKPNNSLVFISMQKPIEIALDILQASLISNNITITKSFQTDEKHNIYENECVQVLLNILINAQNNFDEKGTKNPKILITTKLINDKYTLSISDNGGGIKEDIINKIFDPYFSTKDEKNGTGLGLYMSKMIIEKHHKGKIYAKNTEEGVCFNIEF